MTTATLFKDIKLDLFGYQNWLEYRNRDNNVKKKKVFVTISREFGCDGYPTASSLYELLNEKFPASKWQVFTHPIMESLIKDEELSGDLIHRISEKRYSFANWFIDGLVPDHLKSTQTKVFARMRNLILNLAGKGNCILVGGGSQILTNRLNPSTFHKTHIRIVASHEFKVKSVMKKFDFSMGDAEIYLKNKQFARDKFVYDFTMHSSTENSLYHLIFNNGFNTPEMIARVTFNYMEISGAFEHL